MVRKPDAAQGMLKQAYVHKPIVVSTVAHEIQQFQCKEVLLEELNLEKKKEGMRNCNPVTYLFGWLSQVVAPHFQMR